MTNLEKYNAIFCDVFNVSVDALDDDFCKENVDGWDSIKQFSLTTAIEDEFELLLDPEGMIAFTSYEGGKKILVKNGIGL